MNKRDLQILNDLERFRVMSRNDIIELYFSHLKNPVTSANTVLKRLVRDNQIKVSRSFRPYVYFLYNSTMKSDSTKIPHYLQLVDIYKQLRTYNLRKFIIEPKFTKGLAEPDIYCVLKDVPFFIELQRNRYSQRIMDQKIKRYEALKLSTEFMNKKFPYIILISDEKYKIKTDSLTVFQVSSIQEFINRNKKVNAQPTIKFKVY